MAKKKSKGSKAVQWTAFGVAAGVATAWAAGRIAVDRLRKRPDSHAGEDLATPPPEDLGTVRSEDGTEIAVRAAGPKDAPVVVFAHGITLDMTSWHFQWTEFSDRYRCVLYDQRAHGRSGVPPTGDYSLRAKAGDLRAVLDRVSPSGPVVLVGHSMGGMAIMAFAERFPEEFGARVQGVVFADTSASDIVREALGSLGFGVDRLYRLYSGNLERVDRFRQRFRGEGTDAAFLVAWLTNFGPSAAPSVVEHVARVGAGARGEVWVHTLRSLMDMDLRHALEHVKVPALVIVGDRDRLTPKTSAMALQKALPDARAVVVTRCGHLTMLERPEIFNSLLDEFLGQVLPA